MPRHLVKYTERRWLTWLVKTIVVAALIVPSVGVTVIDYAQTQADTQAVRKVQLTECLNTRDALGANAVEWELRAKIEQRAVDLYAKRHDAEASALWVSLRDQANTTAADDRRSATQLDCTKTVTGSGESRTSPRSSAAPMAVSKATEKP